MDICWQLNLKYLHFLLRNRGQYRNFKCIAQYFRPPEKILVLRQTLDCDI